MIHDYKTRETTSLNAKDIETQHMLVESYSRNQTSHFPDLRKNLTISCILNQRPGREAWHVTPTGGESPGKSVFPLAIWGQTTGFPEESMFKIF